MSLRTFPNKYINKYLNNIIEENVSTAVTCKVIYNIGVHKYHVIVWKKIIGPTMATQY